MTEAQLHPKEKEFFTQLLEILPEGFSLWIESPHIYLIQPEFMEDAICRYLGSFAIFTEK